MDFSSSAIDIARERAGDLPCRFEVARIPPIPPGPFDVVLLLETMLAFPDKETLLQEISAGAHDRRAVRLHPGGGPAPHGGGARAHARRRHGLAHPAARRCSRCLERAGLVVRWQDDCSRSHRAVADSLIDAFAADATDIAAQIGRRALEELLAAHRLWSDWLREGRVRKFAFVAEKIELPGLVTRRGAAAFAEAAARAVPLREDHERVRSRRSSSRLQSQLRDT